MYSLRALFVAVATAAVCAWIWTTRFNWMPVGRFALIGALMLTLIVIAEAPPRKVWVAVLIVSWAVVLRVLHEAVTLRG